MVDAMGRELAAGPVSPGDYVLHATFERKPDYVTKTSLTVSAGQQLIVECHDGFLNCKLKTP